MACRNGRRSLRAGLAGLFVWCTLAGAGCNASVFSCASDDQCGDGWCEAAGFCAFEDPDCSSGRRYGKHAAPELAGECVNSLPDTSTETTLATSSADEVGQGTAGSGSSDESTSGANGVTTDTTGGVTTRALEETDAGSTSTSTSASSDDGGTPGIDCPIGFEDDFEGNALDPDWGIWTAGDAGEVTQAEGVVTLTVPPSDFAWVSIVRSIGPFEGYSVIFELATPPSTAGAIMWFEVTGDTKYEFAISDDELLVRAGAPADPELLTSVALNPVEQRYSRLRAEGGQVEWAVSSNGQSWQLLHTLAASEDELSDTHIVSFGLGTEEPIALGAEASLERIVRCP